MFDAISGTLGLSGAVDTMLLRKRQAGNVTLHVRGRDIEEAEKAIQLGKNTCRWMIIGEAAEVNRWNQRGRVMDALSRYAVACRLRSLRPRSISHGTTPSRFCGAWDDEPVGRNDDAKRGGSDDDQLASGHHELSGQARSRRGNMHHDFAVGAAGCAAVPAPAGVPRWTRTVAWCGPPPIPTRCCFSRLARRDKWVRGDLRHEAQSLPWPRRAPLIRKIKTAWTAFLDCRVRTGVSNGTASMKFGEKAAVVSLPLTEAATVHAHGTIKYGTCSSDIDSAVADSFPQTTGGRRRGGACDQ